MAQLQQTISTESLASSACTSATPQTPCSSPSIISSSASPEPIRVAPVQHRNRRCRLRLQALSLAANTLVWDTVPIRSLISPTPSQELQNQEQLTSSFDLNLDVARNQEQNIQKKRKEEEGGGGGGSTRRRKHKFMVEDETIAVPVYYIQQKLETIGPLIYQKIEHVTHKLIVFEMRSPLASTVPILSSLPRNRLHPRLLNINELVYKAFCARWNDAAEEYKDKNGRPGYKPTIILTVPHLSSIDVVNEWLYLHNQATLHQRLMEECEREGSLRPEKMWFIRGFLRNLTYLGVLDYSVFNVVRSILDSVEYKE